MSRDGWCDEVVDQGVADTNNHVNTCLRLKISHIKPVGINVHKIFNKSKSQPLKKERDTFKARYTHVNASDCLSHNFGHGCSCFQPLYTSNLYKGYRNSDNTLLWVLCDSWQLFSILIASFIDIRCFIIH